MHVRQRLRQLEAKVRPPDGETLVLYVRVFAGELQRDALDRFLTRHGIRLEQVVAVIYFGEDIGVVADYFALEALVDHPGIYQHVRALMEQIPQLPDGTLSAWLDPPRAEPEPLWQILDRIVRSGSEYVSG